MAKVVMKRQARHAPTGRRRPERTRPDLVKGLIHGLIAAVGWIVFVAALGLLLAKASLHKERMLEVNKEHEEKIATLQASVDAATAEFESRTQELAERMEEINDLKYKLKLERFGADRQLKRLQAQQAATGQEEKQLSRQSLVAGDEAALTQESATDLRERYIRVEQLRGRLVSEYRKRYRAAKAVLGKEIDDANPNQLRFLYNQFRESPLGPAFCFAAAETFYKTKKPDDAEPLYQDLTEKYPGSEYEEKARRRLSEIANKERYTPETIFIQPYKEPELLTDTL